MLTGHVIHGMNNLRYSLCSVLLIGMHLLIRIYTLRTLKLSIQFYSFYWQTWGQFNSGIEIDGQFENWNYLFKKMELINLELELKFATKNIFPQIN